MPEEKTMTTEVESIVVPLISGTGDGEIQSGVVATTPGTQPNLIVRVIGPLLAIAIRFAHTYLATLTGLVVAGAATDIIPAADFVSLVLKCSALSLAGAGIGLLKDLVTIFGRLEGKYPLLTGSVCLLLVVGCATRLPPDASPEAKLAVRGDQVVQALRGVLPALKPHVCTSATPVGAPCVEPADALRVARVVEGAFAAAGQLAQALALVDAAKDASERESGLKRAREFVHSIQQQLSQAQVAPGREEARLLVVQLLSAVTNLLFAIGGM